MSPLAAARTHTAAAVASALAAAAALPTHPTLAIVALTAAFVCGGFAAGYRHDARRAARAAERAARPIPDPRPADVTLTWDERQAWAQITHHLQEQQ